eukprot:801929_1
MLVDGSPTQSQSSSMQNNFTNGKTHEQLDGNSGSSPISTSPKVFVRLRAIDIDDGERGARVRPDERVVRQDEMARVLVQALEDLGFEKSARCLRVEADVHVESSILAQLESLVASGDWAGVHNLLPRLGITSARKQRAFKLSVFEQQFLELVEQNETSAALRLLRSDLTPLLLKEPSRDTPQHASHPSTRGIAHLRRLSSLLMRLPDSEAACDGAPLLGDARAAVHSKSRHSVLEALRALVPTDVAPPRGRLFRLIDQAIQHQIAHCPYHNNDSPVYSLLKPHHCARSSLPSHMAHSLQQHTDEVWCAQFSPTGRYLATGSKDHTVLIWSFVGSNSADTPNTEDGVVLSDQMDTTDVDQMDTDFQSEAVSNGLVNGSKHQSSSSPTSSSTVRSTLDFTEGNGQPATWDTCLDPSRPPVVVHTLHMNGPVPQIEWCPDERYLLVCCDTEVVVWDTESGKSLCTLRDHKEPSCMWLPGGRRFITSSLERPLIIWAVSGKKLDTFSWGSRVNHLVVTSPGQYLVTTSVDQSLCLSDLSGRVLARAKCERAITSLACARSFTQNVRESAPMRAHVLVGLSQPAEVQLWAIDRPEDGGLRVIRKFKGHKQSRYMVRCSFGGVGSPPPFVLSGSEDSRVYIWHRHTGQLIASLAGHSGPVNEACWHPTAPGILVSVADDRTVRVWGRRPAREARRDEVKESREEKEFSQSSSKAESLEEFDV